MITLTSISPTFFGGMFDLFIRYLPLYMRGVLFTILLAVAGTFIGLLIAFILVIMKIQVLTRYGSILKRMMQMISKRFAEIYVTVFRGTPMMVQAMLFYYGLARVGVRMPVLVAGLTVVSLNTAAYLTEILRSGLQGLDPGQKEAAESLGMSTRQVYQKILFPQAFRNMIPAIGNELIVNLKDTAVLSVIGATELFYMGRSVAGAHYRYTEAFMITALIYLGLVMVAVYALRKLSDYMGRESKHLLSSESEGMV
ncbi:MAG: amino acid ABC transporter permease [Candidatus Izemoplasmataceae bacterium]